MLQPLIDLFTPVPAPAPQVKPMLSYGAGTTRWRVLSIRQPWAWLILNYGKDIENRTWTTDYRGPLLIHAGKLMADDWRSLCGAMRDEGMVIPNRFDRGGVVGVATLSRIVTKRRTRRDDWFEGPFGWELTDVYQVPFLPLKGQLGLFTADLPTLDYPPVQT